MEHAAASSISGARKCIERGDRQHQQRRWIEQRENAPQQPKAVHCCNVCVSGSMHSAAKVALLGRAGMAWLKPCPSEGLAATCVRATEPAWVKPSSSERLSPYPRMRSVSSRIAVKDGGGGRHLPYPSDCILHRCRDRAPTAIRSKAATRRLKQRRPISHTSTAVHAESSELIVSSTNADMREYTPNTLKTAPISSVYRGGVHAVGPVRRVAGEGIAVAMAGGQCAADTAHLPAELEVIVGWADFEGDAPAGHTARAR